jgi:hypothetical protein
MITIRQQNNIKKTIACTKCSLNFAVIVKKYERIINQTKFFLWKGLGTDTVKIESYLYLCQEEEQEPQ